MFTKSEEDRIRAILRDQLPGITTEATTKSGEEVEVWFSFDGSLNIKSIRQAVFD